MELTQKMKVCNGEIPSLGIEKALLGMIDQWEDYAEIYKRDNKGSLISGDGVVGEDWVRIGYHIGQLFLGKTGRIDELKAGFYMIQVLEKNGFEEKDLVKCEMEDPMR